MPSSLSDWFSLFAAIATVAGVLIALWAQLSSRASLRELESVSSVLATLDPNSTHYGELTVARADLLQKYLQGYRLRQRRVGRTAVTAMLAIVGVVSIWLSVFNQIPGWWGLSLWGGSIVILLLLNWKASIELFRHPLALFK